jgi:bacteriorhodopsin
MPTLTLSQYQLVYNSISFAIAAMGGAFVFFVLSRPDVDAKYRHAITMSALVCFIAGYHYLRIFESWKDAFALEGGMFAPTGEPFNDAYRYIDWLLTVPLLLAEYVALLALDRAKAEGLSFRLIVAAVIMIGTGYVGEVATDGTRATWGAVSTVPFLYILWVLWGEIGEAMGKESAYVQILMRNTRLLLLATWGFYPITYMLPLFGIAAGSAVVVLQLGYSLADVLAKAGYGLMIYRIAKAKSDAL